MENTFSVAKNTHTSFLEQCNSWSVYIKESFAKSDFEYQGNEKYRIACKQY